jgi:hypothetical protein
MTIYCVYFTIYLGDKIPPFYIGSSSINKIRQGYRGSVCSAEYRNIWKFEVKNNSHLFRTFIIPNTSTKNKAHVIELERHWQEAFDVVKSLLFCNKAFAKKGFFTTKESAKLTVVTRTLRGKNIATQETREKIRISKLGNKNPRFGMLPAWKEAGMSNPMLGRKHSLESRKKMSTAIKQSCTEELRQFRSLKMKGSKNPSYGKPAHNRRAVYFRGQLFACIADACKQFLTNKRTVYREGIFEGLDQFIKHV